MEILSLLFFRRGQHRTQSVRSGATTGPLDGGPSPSTTADSARQCSALDGRRTSGSTQDTVRTMILNYLVTLVYTLILCRWMTGCREFHKQTKNDYFLNVICMKYSKLNKNGEVTTKSSMHCRNVFIPSSEWGRWASIFQWLTSLRYVFSVHRRYLLLL